MTAKRGQWSNNHQFLLTCIGSAVGLGNIWRFPYIAYENGGGEYSICLFNSLSTILIGAFLLPYLICSFIIGFPLLYLELSLGQYASLGPNKTFEKMVPVLQG